MRATGANLRMARAQGVTTDRSVVGGMALSNAMVALGGALFAQSQGGADITMGIGTIVIGLAAVLRPKCDSRPPLCSHFSGIRRWYCWTCSSN
ncbi:hypothetical protein OURE66S_04172 [Oligella ureolytica]